LRNKDIIKHHEQFGEAAESNPQSDEQVSAAPKICIGAAEGKKEAIGDLSMGKSLSEREDFKLERITIRSPKLVR
jgi:hypothetical protein